MKIQYLALCAFAFTLITADQSSADILALYEFDQTFVDGAGNERDVSRDLNPDITAGNYDTRTNRTAPGSFGGVAPSTQDVHAFARTANTPNDTTFATNNNYHEFEVTIDNGTWSIDSIHFQYWVNGTTPGETYQATVYSDLIGYGAGQELHIEPYVRQTTLNPEIHTVSITGLQFQSEFQTLAPGTTAGFRILFSDDVSDPTIVHRVDDIELRGFQTAAVPEPAVASVLLLVGGFMVTRRRRRN